MPAATAVLCGLLIGVVMMSQSRTSLPIDPAAGDSRDIATATQSPDGQHATSTSGPALGSRGTAVPVRPGDDPPQEASEEQLEEVYRQVDENCLLLIRAGRTLLEITPPDSWEDYSGFLSNIEECSLTAEYVGELRALCTAVDGISGTPPTAIASRCEGLPPVGPR